MADRVGLGWRPELAAGIFAHLAEIDVVEVIADDLFDGPAKQLRALRTLGAQVPVLVHGVSLGLASPAPVDEKRLAGMARVVDALKPEAWSEHLAFVRGGGVEIGHLAAPPRNAATLEGLARNLDRARAVVGALPVVENVASLIDPPGSTFDECAWHGQVLTRTPAGLLLDLHNLHANATNFGFSPAAFLEALPVERIVQVHLAGGQLIPASDGRPRVLDDHLHDVPDPVYALLAEVARRVPGPLTVVLERDGRYPPFDQLRAELARARAALQAGRASRTAVVAPRVPSGQTVPPAAAPFGSAGAEALLARLYVDADARARFLAGPDAHHIDGVGLALFAHSLAHKRARQRPPKAGLITWLRTRAASGRTAS